ncbi:MAG: hypothetical protein V1493_03175 [Candidatus Diapherotrites archaeon]
MARRKMQTGAKKAGLPKAQRDRTAHELKRSERALQQAGFPEAQSRQISMAVFSRFPESREKRTVLLKAVLERKSGAGAIELASKFEPFHERDYMVRPLPEQECDRLIKKLKKNPENRPWLKDPKLKKITAYHNYKGELYVVTVSPAFLHESVSVYGVFGSKAEKHAQGVIQLVNGEVYIFKTDKVGQLITTNLEPAKDAMGEFRVNTAEVPAESSKGRFLARIFVDEALNLARTWGLRRISIQTYSGNYASYLSKHFGFRFGPQKPNQTMTGVLDLTPENLRRIEQEKEK